LRITAMMPPTRKAFPICPPFGANDPSVPPAA
jgi:hypothetical protein